jgi:hypothetical protein
MDQLRLTNFNQLRTNQMSRSTERELLNNLQSGIKERLQYEIGKGNMDNMSRDEVIDLLNDMSGEIIDNNLPIYYSDMAKLLAENTRFADVDDSGLLPENPTVWDIITMSVYEWLSGEYHELCEEVISELLPDLE